MLMVVLPGFKQLIGVLHAQEDDHEQKNAAN
jgi:hypothetical protein